MVLPFALAIGVGMALGIVGLPLLWMLACAVACAGLYMWNARAPARKTAADAGAARATLPALLMNYAGLVLLMGLVGGAGYMLGGFFGWARLER